MDKTLVEAVSAAIHQNHEEIRDADSHSDLDAACYAVANAVEEWIYGSMKEIPGGYEYLGAASTQICFPLKDGGELRFSATDADVIENITHDAGWDAAFDYYDGKLSGVGVTGPVGPTGGKNG